MVHGKHVHLTRRERQIMDILYAQEEASAAEIQAGIPQAPSYSAVRALLKKLVDKGHVTHRSEGPKYLYSPVLPKQDAKESAIRRLVNTFFEGSSASAVVNLLGSDDTRLDATEVAAIEEALAAVKANQRASRPGRNKKA